MDKDQEIKPISSNTQVETTLGTVRLLCLTLLIFTAGSLIGQRGIEPNYGLALSASGMSVFTFGVTMKPSLVVQQYNPRYGYNYVKYSSIDRQRVKTTTLIFGGIITITGIIVQNIKRKKKQK
tara:strand:- start:146 stop:514 length:369 start_codon:yes stop_codon:yes gene_type:complete